jgi:hypothetical protein
VNILLWHVHGSWTTAFVQGAHRYLVPVTPRRDPDGLGRARTWAWPSSVVERTPRQLAGDDIDLVVLQRPRDEELLHAWLGPRAQTIPQVYVEHNAPQGAVNSMRHPMADRHALHLVHVTNTNALFWDVGSTPSSVIEHGVVDPGYGYVGDVPHVAVVVNEPVRRGRVVGADLLPWLAGIAPLDVFGMGVRALRDHLPPTRHPVTLYEDLAQDDLFAHLVRRRVYVHPFRWTSLGLSLIEAMQLGMPVVALATTDAPDAVGAAGLVSNDLSRLEREIDVLLDDLPAACARGRAAREHAVVRFGLDRFLAEWDELGASLVNERRVA